MYKVLIPEGFFPIDENKGVSDQETIDVNDVLDYLYGLLPYEDYERLRRWIEDCKWSLRNKVSIENLSPFTFGLYELYLVEE